MEFKIFIVEDDVWYGQLIFHHLSLNPDYKVFLFKSGKELLSNMHLQPDLICIDYVLPDTNGKNLLSVLKENNSNLPIIVISGQEDISVAVELLKNGARDYIPKNEHTKDLLWRSIINIRENVELKNEITELKKEIVKKYEYNKTIIGQSDSIKQIFQLIDKSIQSNINVTITGETGTGKELVAKAIHYNSSRQNKPFVAVNMAALPKELVESELFGYEKGAFTGANTQKKGKFEEANEGTLFLDEISEMDLSIQSKILRAIQEREVVRIGGNTPIKTNIRLITATHKTLINEVKLGNFREDLYYRVLGIPIHLPPLRERQNDKLLLTKHFIKEYCKSNSINTITLNEDAIVKIKNHSFPGNIRELKAVIDVACAICENYEIKSSDINFNQIIDENYYNINNKTLEEFNEEIIEFFLKKYNFNVLKVAQILDVSKSKLYKLIKEKSIGE